MLIFLNIKLLASMYNVYGFDIPDDLSQESLMYNYLYACMYTYLHEYIIHGIIYILIMYNSKLDTRMYNKYIYHIVIYI